MKNCRSEIPLTAALFLASVSSSSGSSMVVLICHNYAIDWRWATGTGAPCCAVCSAIRLKIPDAAIAATAADCGMPLVNRDQGLRKVKEASLVEL